jgi:hypothetical protein
MGTAEEFYEQLEKDSPDLISWKGELVSATLPMQNIHYSSDVKT